jgi:riboflavin kinase / FMN adenylyltransferase
MMRLDGDARAPEQLRGGVVALGNFDGFHLGHQAVVGRAIERARAEGRPAIVATFDPHPARLFHPDAPPFLLSTIDQRLRWLAAAGVDGAYVIAFDISVAREEPEQFILDHLVDRLGAVGAVTGADFTFGRDRAGNVETLARFGAAHGLTAEAVAPIRDAGGQISSSRIRRALTANDPREAARLLTRPFTIEGRVDHGAQMGRKLGFPTANLHLGDYRRPPYGVCGVRARVGDGQIVGGVGNLGLRPMFDPPIELLETHLFDYAGDLYDQLIAIELIDFLRPEWSLPDLDALRRQIAADCEAARSRLAAEGGSL